MPLRWEHLDRDFVAKVARTPTAAEAPPSEVASSVMAACIALLLVALYVSVVFHLGGPGLTLLLIALPTTLLTTFHALRNGHRVARPAPSTRMRGYVAGDPTALFAAAALTPVERLYADLLLSVLDVPATMTTTHDQRLLVQEAGVLLARFASLERQRAQLQTIASVGDSPNPAIFAASSDRLGDVTVADPVTQASWERSLDLHADYAATLRALEPIRMRLDAHQEAIWQALRLARATLAYRAASAETLVPPSVETLHAVTLRLADQTRAVEEAVFELRGP